MIKQWFKTEQRINIAIRRSSDNGNSWSAIETIVDYPMGKSASDPSMIVDETADSMKRMVIDLKLLPKALYFKSTT